jgi:hypothetical protein
MMQVQGPYLRRHNGRRDGRRVRITSLLSLTVNRNVIALVLRELVQQVNITIPNVRTTTQISRRTKSPDKIKKMVFKGSYKLARARRYQDIARLGRWSASFLVSSKKKTLEGGWASERASKLQQQEVGGHPFLNPFPEKKNIWRLEGHQKEQANRSKRRLEGK